MNHEQKENPLKFALNAIRDGFQKENDETHLEKVTDMIHKHGLELVDPESFQLYVKYPDDSFYDALLHAVLQNEKEANELSYDDDTLYKLEVYYKHYDLIERQLDQIFESKEGLFASSDKARFVLTHYIAELKHEISIQWNSRQVPFYGTKDAWTKFIDSYYTFMDGKPEVFIQAYAELMDTINADIKVKMDRLHNIYISHPTFKQHLSCGVEQQYYFEKDTHTLKIVIDSRDRIKYICEKNENDRTTTLTRRDAKPDWVNNVLNIK